MADRLPGTYNMDAYRGDTWEQTFRFVRDGVPIDLTGATVACWAVTQTEVFTMTVIVTGNPGEVTITMPTPMLPTGSYSYDVEVTDAGGEVTTWVRGRLIVEQDVTNRALVTR